MTDNPRQVQVVLPVGRLHYPALLKPTQYDKDSAAYYEASVCINMAEFEQSLGQFQAQVGRIADVCGVKSQTFFRSGDSLAEKERAKGRPVDHLLGCAVIRARLNVEHGVPVFSIDDASDPTGVATLNPADAGHRTIISDRGAGGRYAKLFVQVQPYPFKAPTPKGISCRLRAVHFTTHNGSEGDKFGGGQVDPSVVFARQG